MFFRAAILLLSLYRNIGWAMYAQSCYASTCQTLVSPLDISEYCLDGSFDYTEKLNPEYIVIGNIELEGNEKTQVHIIHRELLFAPGDTILLSNFPVTLERSRKNLLNTSLFNFVNITPLCNEINPLTDVKISFVERWYIWPSPTFEIAERNFIDWLFSPSFRRVSYGGYIVHENLRGRKEQLSLLARFGYHQIFSINYNIPYISRKQNLGLSLNFSYSRRNAIENIVGDKNLLFYPEPKSWFIEKLFVRAGLQYRKGIHHHHNLFMEFNNYLFADSLLTLNPNFFPGNQARAPFLGIGYEFRNDHRDSRAYPLRGYYYDIRIKRQGLGLLMYEKTDITQFETSVRKYWELSPDWFFSKGIAAKTMIGDFMPFYLEQGVGLMGDIVRGYEDFVVIEGQHFAVMKANFKYNILPKRIARIGFINNEKFSLFHYALYVNFFSDMGYLHGSFSHNGNPYSSLWLLGSGIGFDLVAYYDKVFRTEFTITRHGYFGVHFNIIDTI